MRYPAADIIDVYDPERISQTMALPWLVAVVMESFNLEEYPGLRQDRGQAGSRVLAVRQAVSRHGHPGIGLQQVPGPGCAQRLAHMEPTCPTTSSRAASRLPYGTDIVAAGHSRPGQQYEPFVKESRRTQSAGPGHDYEAYANDHQTPAYSSHPLRGPGRAAPTAACSSF